MFRNRFVYVISFSIFILFCSWDDYDYIGKMKTYILGYGEFHQLSMLEKTPVEKYDVQTLFIGIISSMDNFRQRQSLRESWLKLLPNTFHYRFVVGEKACSVHPMDRASLYNCEKLDFIMPENATGDSLFYANPSRLPRVCDEESDNNIGFSFHVQYPIVVRFLGLKIRNKMLRGDKLPKVVLGDASTSKEITSVTINIESVLNDSSVKDYIYMRLKYPVILPKGFEGVVKVKGLIENVHEVSYQDSVDWKHGNFIKILDVITRDVKKTSKYYCGLSSFSFSIKDLDELNNYLREGQQRQSEWAQHIHNVGKQLQLEAEMNKDIVFLKVIDVYRNLPQKVLLMFQWVYTNFKVEYVLKTDDDTFIDVQRVQLELANSSGWGWWSCFRVGWPVQRYGKWREAVFREQVYPPFPSGAGYVLSKEALTWLNTRARNLTTDYQGEDVSVGIWLAGMNTSRHVGSECFWACNTQCHSHTCNAMELSVENIYKMWDDFHKCGNKICHCPHPS